MLTVTVHYGATNITRYYSMPQAEVNKFITELSDMREATGYYPAIWVRVEALPVR